MQRFQLMNGTVTRTTSILVVSFVLLATAMAATTYSYVQAFTTVTANTFPEPSSDNVPSIVLTDDILAPSASNETEGGTVNVTSNNTSVNISGTGSTAEVTVDGQTVTVPENGSMHSTVQSDDGTTNVRVTIKADNSATENSKSRTTTRVRMNSSTSTSSTVRTDI